VDVQSVTKYVRCTLSFHAESPTAHDAESELSESARGLLDLLRRRTRNLKAVPRAAAIDYNSQRGA